jgi:hypothetical protein
LISFAAFSAYVTTAKFFTYKLSFGMDCKVCIINVDILSVMAVVFPTPAGAITEKFFVISWAKVSRCNWSNSCIMPEVKFWVQAPSEKCEVFKKSTDNMIVIDMIGRRTNIGHRLC